MGIYTLGSEVFIWLRGFDAIVNKSNASHISLPLG